MTDMALLSAKVQGRVQGVFFRAFVQVNAQRLGLSGYVRNLHDGSVEVLAEGRKTQLDKLIEFLKTGPPHAVVREVTEEWSEYTGNFTDFNIEY